MKTTMSHLTERYLLKYDLLNLWRTISHVFFHWTCFGNIQILWMFECLNRHQSLFTCHFNLAKQQSYSLPKWTTQSLCKTRLPNQCAVWIDLQESLQLSALYMDPGIELELYKASRTLRAFTRNSIWMWWTKPWDRLIIRLATDTD